VDISAESKEHPTWKQPVRTVFRRAGDGWTLVGLERLPDAPEPKMTSQKPAQKPTR